MKIKLNINNKLKKKNTQEPVKEYKFSTENMSAKLTTAKDNIIKLEIGENKKRKGYIEKSEKKGIIKKYVNNFFKNENKLSKSYYRLFLAMLLLSILSTILVVKNYKFADLEDYLTYSLNSEEVVQASSSIDTSDITEEAVLKQNLVQSSNTVVTKPTEEKVVIEKLVFKKPLEGEILKIFSIDKVIYSKTLELWKTHDGIDIKGSIGQSVYSIEKGKIEKVYEDSFLGFTVVVDHGQGYKSSYSNLSENIPVKQGQIVTKGEILGQISNSSIGEIKDEPHLHFMLMKDGEIVDPTYIMKN